MVYIIKYSIYKGIFEVNMIWDDWRIEVYYFVGGERLDCYFFSIVE